MSFDLDMSAIGEELTRVTTDKKPGAIKKTGTFMDKVVKMPKQDGYVTIRLLPPGSGQKLPWFACRVHNLGTPEKANNLYCGRVLQDRRWVGDCFFCDYYNHLYKEADKARASGNVDKADDLVAKAKFIKPQEKYYFNAIVRGSNPSTGQTEADGVLIYNCGVTIYNNILEAVAGNKEMDKEPKGNVFHPKTGRDFKIVKKMKPGGQFPDYSGSEWKDVSVLSKDEEKINGWLNNMNDLYALRTVLSTEDMKKQIRIFEGKEKDPRNQFDASFLEEQAHAAHPTTSVNFHSNPAPTAPVASKVVNNVPNVPDVTDVSDEPLVDDDFTRSVRNALGSDD
jgi:hypothetical protein